VDKCFTANRARDGSDGHLGIVQDFERNVTRLRMARSMIPLVASAHEHAADFSMITANAYGWKWRSPIWAVGTRKTHVNEVGPETVGWPTCEFC